MAKGIDYQKTFKNGRSWQWYAKWNQPYGKGLYIVQFDNGIKLGRTETFQTRIRNYFAPWCKDIQSCVFIADSNNRVNEKKLKDKFKNRLTSGNSSEFFQMDQWEMLMAASELTDKIYQEVDLDYYYRQGEFSN